MCNNKQLLVNYHTLKMPETIMLGDGKCLEATRCGTFVLVMKVWWKEEFQGALHVIWKCH